MYWLKKVCSLFIIFIVSINLASCVSSKNASVATVDGEKISKEEFVYFLTNVKKQIEGDQGPDLPEDFWETAEIDGKKVMEAAKEKALEEAVKSKLSRKKALEAGLKITSEQRQDINNRIGQLVAKYGNEGMNDYLKEFGLNKSLYEKVLEDSYYRQSLMESLTENVDQAAAKEFFDQKIARVKHILIMTIDPQTRQPLEIEKLEDAKIRADKILSEVKAGADFDKYVAEYSEDPGSASVPDGYYIGKNFALGQQGGMVPAFENASLELEVGGISDIVETSFGFHIIKRYPNDQAMYEQNPEEVLHYAKNDKFEEILEGWKNESKIEKNEKEYGQIQVNK